MTRRGLPSNIDIDSKAFMDLASDRRADPLDPCKQVPYKLWKERKHAKHIDRAEAAHLQVDIDMLKENKAIIEHQTGLSKEK